MSATNLQSPTDHLVQLTSSYLPKASQWLPGLLPSTTQGTGCGGGMRGQQGGLALSLLPCLEPSRARLFQQTTDPNSRTQLWFPGDSQNMSQMSVPHMSGGHQDPPSWCLITCSSHSLCPPGFWGGLQPPVSVGPGSTPWKSCTWGTWYCITRVGNLSRAYQNLPWAEKIISWSGIWG